MWNYSYIICRCYHHHSVSIVRFEHVSIRRDPPFLVHFCNRPSQSRRQTPSRSIFIITQNSGFPLVQRLVQGFIEEYPGSNYIRFRIFHIVTLLNPANISNILEELPKPFIHLPPSPQRNRPKLSEKQHETMKLRPLPGG
jgi:hypothetical protein